MGEVVMYDLYDEGRYVGRYPIAALAVMLSIQYPRLIANYAREGRTYRKRYQFERVDEPICAELADEWDKARQRFLRLGR